MGRMHCPGKGKSRSSLPYNRNAPSWVKMKQDDIEKDIQKFAKKGLTPSKIGITLRDQSGVPRVKFIGGETINRILKKQGLAQSLPESLYYLIKKAVVLRKHHEKNRKDKDAKFRLILSESRIHRTARYHKAAKHLPPNWRYESGSAAALVQG
jgi:small subunit ribosomal protein S13e